MLVLTLPEQEYYDEQLEQFVTYPKTVLKLEHSLVAISKWESYYEKPFLDNTPKTVEETVYYIECMAVEEPSDPMVYSRIANSEIEVVNAYLAKEHTATWFNNEAPTKSHTNQTVTTSELIYYYMVSLQIPFEAQYWNIKRLITLIKVINLKNQPPKKMSQKEAMMQAKKLNEQRKAQYGTRG